jgi:predicted membrane channel-forming protein YqfA (hemolysin III family)
MKTNNTWAILYYIGLFLVLVATITTFTKLSLQSQPIFAIASAVAWFLSAFLFYLSPTRMEINRKSHVKFFLFGIVEISLAVLFWTILESEIQIAKLVSIINMMFGFPSFITAYMALASKLGETKQNP